MFYLWCLCSVTAGIGAARSTRTAHIQEVDQTKTKITPQHSKLPITKMVAHARREYLPTDHALSLSIGRPNSLAAGAFSVGNISNTPRHKSGYYGICLLGITIRKFLSLCVNFATCFIVCACLCRRRYIQAGNRVGSRGAASPPGPTIPRKRSIVGPRTGPSRTQRSRSRAWNRRATS